VSVLQRIKDDEGNYVRDGNEQDGVGKKECWVQKWKGSTEREKTSSDIVDEVFSVVSSLCIYRTPPNSIETIRTPIHSLPIIAYFEESPLSGAVGEKKWKTLLDGEWKNKDLRFSE